MKTTFLKISALVVIFALMGAGCEKEKEDYDPTSIVGKWKWIYSTGGIAGTTYPHEGQSVVWTFNEDSTLIVSENWETTINTKFHVSRDSLKFLTREYKIKLNGETLSLFEASVFNHYYKRIK